MIRNNILIWVSVMALLAAAGSAHAASAWRISPGSPASTSQSDWITFKAGFGGLTWPANWDSARWYVGSSPKHSETMGGQSDTSTFTWTFSSPGTYYVHVRGYWNILGIPYTTSLVTWTVNVITSVPDASRDSPSSPVKLYEGDGQAFTVRGTDQGGDLKGARWWLDSVGQGDFPALSGASGTHTWSRTFDTKGTYTVEAQVYDDHGYSSSKVAWTVNVTCLHVLRLFSSTGGSVTSPGEGIFQYDEGTDVTLVATPDEGYHFTHWSGGISDTSNPCELTLMGRFDVKANFEADAPPEQRTLTVLSTGGGCVSTPGEGKFEYDPGSVVTLEATAGPMCRFVGWSGTAVDLGQVADPGASGTTVTLEKDGTVCANFVSTLAAIYVDDDAPADPGPGDAAVSDPNENGTLEHPFDAIQEAIDVADEGVCVIVRGGIYFENINLLGKNILLTGLDPDGSSANSYPVIDGAGAGPVVSFAGGEGPDCSLIGFVVTRGEGEPTGGLYCAGSSPTVANCLVVGNRSTGPGGGAVYCADSNAVFVNCTISGNYGGEGGAGLYTADSNAVLVGSIVWANLPNEIVVGSGPDPNLTYCDIDAGWPGVGNIDADPLFALPGAWVDLNHPDVVVGPAEPHTGWADGDYHLLSERGRYVPAYSLWTFDGASSPCIDSGDPSVDASGERPPNGERINMGAYGGTNQASMSP